MSGRRRLSATARVALAISIVLAGAILLLTVLAYVVTARGLSRELDLTLRRESDAYAAAIEGAPSDQGLVDATRAYLGARTGAGTGVDPVLIAALGDGRILSNSSLSLETAPGNIAAREPTTAAGGFSSVEFRERTYRVLTTPIIGNSGSQVGVFQVALATNSARRVAEGVAAVVGGAGLVVFGLGVLVSLWVSRESLRPLRRMAADAQLISHGTADRRIAYDGPPDELGSLAQSLNSMLARIQLGTEEQRRFVADASHELRTPLAVIRGSAELAEHDDVPPTERAEALELIVSESDRMKRLLDDLLTLARLEEAPSHNPQPLHAPTLVEEAAARARAVAGDVTVDYTSDCDVWIVADPDQLDQALLNLVRNAVRAAGPGGHVDVSCSSDERDVSICVTDDGPGIPASDVDRVFDRFFRGGSERATSEEGAGLGLAITQRLINLQNGTVRASNIKPHGARFTISLPRHTDPRG